MEVRVSDIFVDGYCGNMIDERWWTKPACRALSSGWESKDHTAVQFGFMKGFEGVEYKSTPLHCDELAYDFLVESRAEGCKYDEYDECVVPMLQDLAGV